MTLRVLGLRSAASMAKRDYYEVLGVDRDADKGTLKKAYRKLAMELHPDRNPDNPEAEAGFKEASEAYAVLNDAQKRQVYDRFGHSGLEGRQTGFNDVGDIFSHFQDFFGDFFGGGGGGRPDGPQRGADFATVIELSIQDCILGAEKEIELQHPDPCTACDATGAKDGKLNRCTACGGAGRVAARRGSFIMQTACPSCRGAGATAEKACGECRGSGEVSTDRKVRVNIPAGINEGQRLRISGKGQSGARGGPAGHLYVDVRIEADPVFTRDGYDLVTPVKLSFPQAALGAKLEVPNPEKDDATLSLVVPAGVQPGDTLTIEEAGIPRLDGRGRGDVVCVMQVDVPKELTPRAQELIEELAKTFDS